MNWLWGCQMEENFINEVSENEEVDEKKKREIGTFNFNNFEKRVLDVIIRDINTSEQI